MSRLLKRGDRGQSVFNLQAALKRAGYSPGPIDGIYGPLTTQAVAAFQKAHGLRVDGVAGPQTLATLEAVLVHMDRESRPPAPVVATETQSGSWLPLALILGGLWYLMR